MVQVYMTCKSLNCREVKQMSEVRHREHYDKPSVKRKKIAEAARRKNAKR